MRYWLFGWIYGGVLCSVMAADDCRWRLDGILTDATTRQPLIGATCWIDPIANGTVSDTAGHFSFQGLCSGTYHIQMQMLGYEPLDTVLEMTQNTHLMLSLRPAIIQLQPFQITATRLPEHHISLQQTAIEGRQLQRLRGKSLGESLTGISGVTVLQTGPTIAKPVIHGLHSNRIVLLQHGVRQEGQQWGSEHAPEIDPFAAERLTVIKGAASVQYGADAIGGVILIDPAPLRQTRGMGGEVHLVGAWNGGAGALAARIEQGNSGGVQGLSWRLQGSIQRAGNFATPTYLLQNTGVAAYNLAATLGYQRNQHQWEVFYSHFTSRLGIFKGSHIGNLSDLKYAIHADTPFYATQQFSYRIARPAQDIRHQLAKISYQYQIHPQHTLRLKGAFQLNYRGEYDAHRIFGDTTSALTKAALALDLKTYSVDAAWEHRSGEHWAGTAGASFLFQDNTNKGTQEFIPNYYSLNAGIYALQRYSRQQWQLEAGLRYDYKWLGAAMYREDTIYRPQLQYHNVAMVLGWNIQPHRHWQIQGQAATAWRAPAPNELFSKGVHHSAASYEIGNEALRPEKAYNMVLSLDYKLPKWLKMNASGYIHYICGFIYTQAIQPPTLTIRGAFPTFRYAQTDALLTGFDLRLQGHIWKGLSAESQFAMVRGYNLTDQDFLPFMPADRWTNALRYEYISDSTAGLSAYFLSLGANTVFKQTHVDATQDYAPPPAAYTLLGIAGGMTWTTKKGQEYEWSITVDNLLNTRYRDYLDRFRYYMDALGRNITLRLRVRL